MNLLQTGAVVLKVIRRNSPILISAAAGIGLILIYYLTIKETEQAVEEINETPEEEVHSFKMAKKIVKIYAPSFILLIFTLFCIIQSTVISQHRIRDLTAYSASLAAYYNQYRAKVIDIYGSERDHEIRGDIARDEAIYREPVCVNDEEFGYLCQMAGYGPYFTVRHLTDIYKAFIAANKIMDTGPGEVKLKKWMELAGAVQYDDMGNIVPFNKHYENYGWSTYDLTRTKAVSALYPYVGRIDEDSGLEIYFIDVPEPQPLELIGW